MQWSASSAIRGMAQGSSVAATAAARRKKTAVRFITSLGALKQTHPSRIPGGKRWTVKVRLRGVGRQVGG